MNLHCVDVCRYSMYMWELVWPWWTCFLGQIKLFELNCIIIKTWNKLPLKIAVMKVFNSDVHANTIFIQVSSYLHIYLKKVTMLCSTPLNVETKKYHRVGIS